MEDAELHIACSVGIAMSPDHTTDVDELMRHADTAMYQAKAAGKDCMQFFTAEMTERMLSRIHLDANLRGVFRRAYRELVRSQARIRKVKLEAGVWVE